MAAKAAIHGKHQRMYRLMRGKTLMFLTDQSYCCPLSWVAAYAAMTKTNS